MSSKKHKGIIRYNCLVCDEDQPDRNTLVDHVWEHSDYDRAQACMLETRVRNDENE